jgi:hypothetical protein
MAAVLALLLVAATAHAAKAPFGGEVTVADGGATAPDVAYNGTRDEFLVVWNDASTVRGRILSADLAHASDAFDVSDQGGGGVPKAAFDADRDEYLVVWVSPLGQGSEVLGQRLRADGSETGSNDFSVSPSGGAGSVAIASRAGHDEYGIAWDADGQAGREIFLRRIGGGGARAGGAVQVSDAAGGPAVPSDPTLAYDSGQDQYLAAWLQTDPPDYRVVGRQLAADSLSGGPLLQISGGPVPNRLETIRSTPRAANRIGGGYFVVWSEQYDYTGPWVAGDSVTATGQVGGGAFSVRYPSIRDPFQTNGSRNPALAFDPPSGQFEVVYQGGNSTGPVDEIYGLTRYDGTDPFQVSGAGGLHYDSGEPAIAYGGRRQEHLVVWRSAGPPGSGYRVLARRLAGTPAAVAGDRRRPHLNVSIRRLQRILRWSGLVFRAACDEPCRIAATARVSGRGVKRRLILQASRSLPANRVGKLKLTAPSRTFTALRRWLKHRKRLTARITVTATDAAGNRRTSKWKIRAKR